MKTENQGSITIFAEPTFRYPAINAFDFRASKFFNFGKHKFEFIMDVFNLTNANVVTDFNVNTRSVFQEDERVRAACRAVRRTLVVLVSPTQVKFRGSVNGPLLFVDDL